MKQNLNQSKSKPQKRKCIVYKNDLFYFMLLGILGVIFSYVSVNIPHTEVYLEVRWLFGYMGFALLCRSWVALLLMALLSLVGFHKLPLEIAFIGNMLYAFPIFLTIRLTHEHLLSRLKKPVLYGISWFIMILLCYQLFTTPIIWAFLAVLNQKPILPALWEGWQDQPFLIESLLVGIISAFGMTTIRINTSLQKSEEKFRSFVENANDIIYSLSLDGIFTYVSPNWTEMLGHDVSEVIGRSFIPFVHPDDVERCQQFFGTVIATGEKKSKVEYRVLHKNGSWRWHISNASPIKNSDGEVTSFLGIARDITDRKRAEEALKDNRSLLDQAEAVAKLGSFHWNIQSDTVTWSKNLYNIFGRDPELGLPSVEWHQSLMTPEDWQRFNAVVEAALKEKKGYTIEAPLLLSNGEKRYIRTTAEPEFDAIGNLIGFIGITQDITQQKKTEQEKEKIREQLLHSQKLEAIGRLAGGVAHDFNNFLQAIHIYSEILQMEVDDDSPLLSHIVQITNAADSAASLSRQLLAFSRRQILEKEILNINEVLNNLEKMLKRIIGEDIELITTYESDPKFVKADRGQIEQIIMNLVINARDAMPVGGTISISVKNITIDELTQKIHPDAQVGEVVCIIVSDNGMGMDRATKQQIFEPFFSTKKPGGGTGLGLSTVYGIVEQHDGWINVYSELGKGTTFHIYIPMSEEKTAKSQMDVPYEKFRGGGERILFVEDEEMIRKVTVNILEKKGFQVFVAENVVQAYTLFQQENGRFDLVISDVVLPDGNGLSLIKKLLELNPELPVIMSSGYTDRKSQWESIKKMGMKFLQKPYSLVTLLKSIHEVIEK